MNNFRRFINRAALSLAVSVVTVAAFAQPASRGSAVVYPLVFDQTGTPTARAKAESALNEILKKGGFRVIDSGRAASRWRTKGLRVPTISRPPSVKDLTRLGRAVGVQYVVTSHITFHTRSIWVNLGPKTISSCHMAIAIVDSKLGKIVHQTEADGRSDEKSDGLKVAASLLITPLVTAVSGGPKTPQETRAAQIASARGLESFVTVQQKQAQYVGSWEWIRFDGMDDRIIQVDDPSRYRLNLAANGSVSGLADVNRFQGQYKVDGAAISFGDFAITKVGVPEGSLHDTFLRGLRDASSFVMRDGTLNIALKVDAGIMVFRRVK